MNASIETVRRVYNNDEGVFLEVGPGSDGFGIALETTSEASHAWFGKINLLMSAAFAAKLGEALIAASKEAQ